MLLKPVCARKAFLWGSAKDLCSGTRALLGECFLWSPPTRLGLALTMYVFYPSALGPWGSHQAPVTPPGRFPEALSLHFSLRVKGCLGPWFCLPLRAPVPWEGASGLQTPVWLPGGLAHKAPLLHAASLSNSISVTVFIRISLILWGHKPISSGAKGMPYLKERGVRAPWKLCFFQWFSLLSEAALDGDCSPGAGRQRLALLSQCSALPAAWI